MKYEVAILGGGIIGTSVAYHLATLGQKKVVVLEADTVGCGSTARSVGGIRTIFKHPLETDLSLYSWDAYIRLEQECETSFNFQRCGYLLLVNERQRGVELLKNAERARSLAVAVENLSQSDLQRLIPGVTHDDMQSAVLSPTDGFTPVPHLIAQAYAARAQQLGAQILENTTVIRVERRNNAFALVCADQVIEARQIVIALNAFASPILDSLGVKLASYPYPRHVFAVSSPAAELSSQMPITIFQDDDLMLRHDGDTVLAICGFVETSSTSLDFDPVRLPHARERIARRISLDKSTVTLAWSGLRAMTPDRRALVGKLPGNPNAWCAIGFSGHGFMHAPAIGLGLAEQILERTEPRFDFAPLDPSRWTNPQTPPPILETIHV